MFGDHRIQFDDGILPFVHDPISDLYDAWYNSPWNPQKYTQYLVMKQIPFLSWNMNIYEGKKENDLYMKSNQLDWSDVNRPNKLPGTAQFSAGVGGTLNYVSDNIRRLYK